VARAAVVVGGDRDPRREHLVARLDSRRPEALRAVGVIGLAIILWLMGFKPA